MKFSYKNVMKMLKDPKNCAIVTVVFLVLVIGGLYMFRKSREGFQSDPNNPCDGCDADVLSNDKAVECAAAGCFDDEDNTTTTAMDMTTTAMDSEITTTSMESEMTTTSMDSEMTTTSNDMGMGDSPM